MRGLSRVFIEKPGALSFNAKVMIHFEIYDGYSPQFHWKTEIDQLKMLGPLGPMIHV